MIRRAYFRRLPLAVLLVAALSACMPVSAAGDAVRLPAATLDAPETAPAGDRVAVLAGGCFWGLEAVFEHVKGVRSVVSGYSGGSADTAHYARVSGGNTGHAETVKIRFDPTQVSYGTLLQVFFSVATDPTQLNRQGPDSGTQYRSAIFYANPLQKKIAAAYLAQLTSARSFPAPIVTQLVPLKAFYPAETYHQHYAQRHPDDPYIVYNDAPKVVHLQQLFPDLYQPRQSVVSVQLH